MVSQSVSVAYAELIRAPQAKLVDPYYGLPSSVLLELLAPLLRAPVPPVGGSNGTGAEAIFTLLCPLRACEGKWPLVLMLNPPVSKEGGPGSALSFLPHQRQLEARRRLPKLA